MIVAVELDRRGRTSPGHVKQGTLRISIIESLEFRKAKIKNFENRNLIRLNQVRLRKRILREISRRGIVGTTAIRAADRVRMLSAVLNSGIMILRRWNSFC